MATTVANSRTDRAKDRNGREETITGRLRGR